MPTYEYQCAECNYKFEELATISKRENPKLCPQCGHASFKTDRLYAIPCKFGPIEDNN